MNKKLILTKLKNLLKKLFHSCNCVQEVYRTGRDNIRLAECTECGKFYLVDFNKKKMKNIKFKKYNNISIYIKTLREEQH